RCVSVPPRPLYARGRGLAASPSNTRTATVGAAAPARSPGGRTRRGRRHAHGNPCQPSVFRHRRRGPRGFPERPSCPWRGAAIAQWRRGEYAAEMPMTLFPRHFKPILASSLLIGLVACSQRDRESPDESAPEDLAARVDLAKAIEDQASAGDIALEESRD